MFYRTMVRLLIAALGCTLYGAEDPYVLFYPNRLYGQYLVFFTGLDFLVFVVLSAIMLGAMNAGKLASSEFYSCNRP